MDVWCTFCLSKQNYANFYKQTINSVLQAKTNVLRILSALNWYSPVNMEETTTSS